MAEAAQPDRYIPFRKRDIVAILLADGGLTTPEAKRDFQKLCDIVGCIFHHEFFKKLERLKNDYFPLNPDLDKRRQFKQDEIDHSNKQVFELLREVLKDGNFDELSRDQIREAFNESAVLSVTINVDMNDFEEVHFYYRGKRVESIEKKRLFGLKKYYEDQEILERVCIFVRFKQKEYFEKQKRRELLFEPGTTVIKLFKNVPTEDLEILFPNSRVTMTLKDKLVLGVPAVVAGIPLLVTKVLPAVLVVAVILGVYFRGGNDPHPASLKDAVIAFGAGAALGGFVLRQWTKYKNMKYQFQKQLSDNLYFRNLVNNSGVFHALIDSAEEEEVKEGLLAYYFLYTTPRDLTRNELDGLIEQWFETKHGCKLDFECPDALRKLERLRLLETKEGGVLKVCDLREALRRLDEGWDNIFQYNQAADTHEGPGKPASPSE